MKVFSLLATLLSAVSVKSAVLRDENFLNVTTALEHADRECPLTNVKMQVLMYSSKQR